MLIGFRRYRHAGYRYVASSLMLSVVLAAGMVPGPGLSAVAAAQEAEGANAESGTDLVSIDFDDGGTDGFAIYTEGGACEISNAGGALDVAISNCGSLNYANQVYWDGFALEQNCVYTYSFDLSCDIPRKVEYRLQLNGGDYHAYQGEWLEIGPETLHFSVDWTM